MAAQLTVLDGGRVFKRRAIKNACTPEAYEVTWHVAELNGVRVYVDESGSIVVTTQDINP